MLYLYNSVIGVDALAKAPADGYTMAVVIALGGFVVYRARQARARTASDMG